MSSSTSELHGYYRWHAQIYDLTRWAFLFGRTELIRHAAKQTAPRRILEIGCGTGKNLVELARQFPQARIVGLDLSADMLEKAQRKVAGLPVSLVPGAYVTPVNAGEPFDLIVFSYCLTMINPGFDEVLKLCLQDLSPRGKIAVVDFHDSPWGWFRTWMGVNHVRMEGQILGWFEASGLQLGPVRVRRAYGGIWRRMECFAGRELA